MAVLQQLMAQETSEDEPSSNAKPPTPSNCDFIQHTANTSAVLDAPVGNSYVDPIPIASHVISMDAVEGTENHISYYYFTVFYAFNPCLNCSALTVDCTYHECVHALSCSLDSIQPVSPCFKHHVETALDADSAVCREHSSPSHIPRGVIRE